jgi:hypothetical protein
MHVLHGIPLDLAAANGLEEDELDRIRRGDDPSDARLRALFGLARALTNHRGHLSTDEVGTVAGDLEPAEFLEVIARRSAARRWRL